jgi:CIC family chloride channel protein
VSAPRTGGRASAPSGRVAAPSPSDSLAAAVPTSRPGPVARSAAWLAGTQLGLVLMALLAGAGAGLGAAVFRELIFGCTWLVTGHQQFGQQGHASSTHFVFLGLWFVLLAPVVGGLLYGPLIQRFAREARGHGVPEVMLAVAENGGRIRPPVTIVKALASAICIGTGGSVGREGPIVQIGSALASSLGQLVGMAETRMRIIVACGAAGGIAATFNAPITGLFFGFEIVLREFSLDAVFATALSAVTADIISRALFGAAPFFSAVPHNLLLGNDFAFGLMAVLGVLAGLVGFGFKAVLYGMEDRADTLWRGRPEWLRPVVGGLGLGALLLALPQMYGVGYPVMDRVLGGHEVLGFILILMIGKILASSLTLSIGGSGGVFAPSLFTGAAGGMAFGVIVHSLFGSAAGPTAAYGVVGMGGVFAGASQAPLTAIASVAEMTGNFTLTLPIVLVNGIAAAVSRRLSYGSIYTTKLLRRGIDIERPKAAAALRARSVAEVMQPLRGMNEAGRLEDPPSLARMPPPSSEDWRHLVGPVLASRQPQALFADEDLAQALRQLIVFGQNGLPVVSHETSQLEGWLTRNDVIAALGQEVQSEASPEPAPGPQTPLIGFELLELLVATDTGAVSLSLREVAWPPGCVVVAVTEGGEVRAARPDARLAAGERVLVLAPLRDSARLTEVPR